MELIRQTHLVYLFLMINRSLAATSTLNREYRAPCEHHVTLQQGTASRVGKEGKTERGWKDGDREEPSI